MDGERIERIGTVDEAVHFLNKLGIEVRDLVAAMMVDADYTEGVDAAMDVQAGRDFLDGIIREGGIKIPAVVRRTITQLLPEMCQPYSRGTGEVLRAGSDSDEMGRETYHDLLAQYYSNLVGRIIEANRKDVLRVFFRQCKGCEELKPGSEVRTLMLQDLQGRVIDVFRNDNYFVDIFPALVDGFLDYLFENRNEIEPRVTDD